MATTHGMPTMHGYTLCDQQVGRVSDRLECCTKDPDGINCLACLVSPLHLASKRTPRPDEHFTLPEQHVRALLQAVLAWRRQGAASRWSTEPSRALVAFTDRIREVFPALCEELLPTDPFTICGYEDCDQAPTVTLADGNRMCRHHAISSLATGMLFSELRAALKDADRDMGEMARLAKLADEEQRNG